jgi:transposase
LNIAGMVKNHNLAKAISDASWAQFVGFGAYKAVWAGGQVLRVDRSGTLWVPSSKLCSDCGHKHKSLTARLRLRREPGAHWARTLAEVLEYPAMGLPELWFPARQGHQRRD